MKIEQILVGNMAVFCYLVWCEESKEALLIDPAGNEEQLMDKIEQLGLTLKYIVNTHGHGDHTSGNRRVKELSGAEIVMHEADDTLFRSPEAIEKYKKMGLEASPPADKTVKHGDTITIGTIAIEVIHTPGHSPGGICLLCEGNLFSGDTLFVGGVGRTDLPGSDHNLFMPSLKDKLLTLPDETVVWPGHHYGPRPTSTIGTEKIANPWLRQLTYMV